MSIIHFFETRETASGRVGVEGHLRLRPLAARVIAGTPDEEVTRHPFTVDVPSSGLVDFQLSEGLWEVRFTPKLGGPMFGWGPVYVMVGAAAEYDWPELPRLDPDTLDPAAEPEAAWWAALELAALSLDGGSPSTVFTLDQHIDGGVA